MRQQRVATPKVIVGLLALTISHSANAVVTNSSLHTSSSLSTLTQELQQAFQSPDYSPHIDLGGYLFNDHPYPAGVATLFVPFNTHGKQLFYGTLRSYAHGTSRFSGGGALGYRRLFSTSSNQQTHWNMLGFHADYDRFHSDGDNWFNQVTVGEEFWHNQWFIGSNLYIPLGEINQFDEDANAQVATRPVGSNDPNSDAVGHILYGCGHEVALPGVDAEVGYYDLWRGLALYGGGYFFRYGSAPTVTGPKARAEYNWFPHNHHRLLWLFNRVSLESEVRYDKPNGTTWYGGIRLTTNLLPNSSYRLQGVSRHMIDPIRRRMETTTVSYHDDLRYLYMNGHIANVKYVSNADAVQAAAADSNIDIIAVQNSIQMASTLDLGSGRNMVVTGGAFNFNVGGCNFRLNTLGHNGTLIAASGQTLIQLVSNAQDVSLQYINLITNPTEGEGTAGEEAITNNNGDGFGTLSLNHVTTNGALYISVGSNQSGTVNVQNSTFNTDLLSDASGLRAAITLEATGSNSLLTVTGFTNNTVNASRNSTGDLYGVFNHAENGGALVYSGDFAHNTINATGSGNGDVIAVLNEADAVGILAPTTATINFNGNFSHNIINATSSGSTNSVIGVKNFSDDVGLFQDTTTIINFNGAFSNNQITASGDNTVIGVQNGVESVDPFAKDAQLNFNGAFSDNQIQATATGFNGNATGVSNLIFASSQNSDTVQIVFNGDFSNNQISANGTVKAVGVENAVQNTSTISPGSANIIYNGSFSNNQIHALNAITTLGVDTNANGDSSNIQYNGNFTNNTISSANGNAVVFVTNNDGTISVHTIANNSLSFAAGMSGFSITANSGKIDFTDTLNEAALESLNGGTSATLSGSGIICFQDGSGINCP